MKGTSIRRLTAALATAGALSGCAVDSDSDELTYTPHDAITDPAAPEGATGTARDALGTPTCQAAAAGLYCHHDLITNGAPGVLYKCTGAGATATVSQMCSDGCQKMPNGVNDRCYIAPVAGWASTTHYRDAKTAVQAAVVAGTFAGNSPQSITGAPWLTDLDGGDGTRMINALTVLDSWYHSKSPLPSLPLSPAVVPALVRTNMDAKVTSYNQTDRSKLLDQMITHYAGSVPAAGNATLSLLAIRAQCKEYADRRVANSGGVKKLYTGNGLANSSRRPGMYAFRSDLGHAAVLLDIEWDASGNALNYRFGESNYANTWSNPLGAVPWLRMVTTNRTASASGYVIVSSE